MNNERKGRTISELMNGTKKTENTNNGDVSCSRVFVDRQVYDQDEFDYEYGYIKTDGMPDISSKLKNYCKCSKEKLIDTIVSFVPILEWLPKYDFRRDIVSDFIAGITVGIMHIPQGMAYAGLASLLPVYGLYTSFFPALFYMFFGTSKHVSLGVFAVVSLMVGSVRLRILPGEPEEFLPKQYILETSNGTPTTAYSTFTTLSSNSSSTGVPPMDYMHDLTPIEIVTALTFTVGIVQLIMGILHLGFLTAYLSDQVISGFTTGAAFHVFTAQLNKIIGVPLPRHSGPGRLFLMYYDLILDLKNTNWMTVVVSVITMVGLFIGKELINPKFKKRFRIPLPFELFVVIIGTGVSYFLNLHDDYKVKVVDLIPTGLPAPTMPRFELVPMLIGDAIGIAIVIFVVNVSMGKLFAKRHFYRIDPGQEAFASSIVHLITPFFSCHPSCASLTRSCVMSEMCVASQELYALGIMECLCSLFSVYPASTALARSLVYEQAGTRTQLATVFSCSLLLIVLLWIGPLFQALPMCILASIIIVALKGMFMQFSELKHIWPVSKLDFTIWIVSFLATVCLDVREGLATSVFFALFTVILRSQWPPSLVMGKIPGTDLFRNVFRYKEIEQVPGVRIFRFDSPLIFTNCELFREELYERCDLDVQNARTYLNNMKTARDCKLSGENGVDIRDTKDPPTESDSLIFGPVSEVTNVKGETILRITTYPTHVILDCSGFNYVDYMGLLAMRTVFIELDEIGVRLLFSSCKAPVRDRLERFDFYSRVPKNTFYPSIRDAVVWALANRDCRLSKLPSSADLDYAPQLTSAV